MKAKKTFKVGRAADTGRFITVKHALRRKKSAVVETIKRSCPPKKVQRFVPKRPTGDD